MSVSRKLIKKVKYDGLASRGFIFYCWNENLGYTIDKMTHVINQIKKDFPNVKDKHIAIKTFSNDEVILFFYYTSIPIDMKFDEILKTFLY